MNAAGFYAESNRRGTRADATGATLPSITVAAPVGQRGALGPIASLSVTAAHATASAAINMTVALVTVTVGGPAGSIQAGGTVTSGLGTITVTAPEGAGGEIVVATGDVGEITVMAADATVDVQYIATGALGTVLVSAPDGAGAGDASVSAALGSIGVSAMAGGGFVSVSTAVDVGTVTVSAPAGAASSSGGSGLTAHRYWRVFLIKNGGGGFSGNQLYLYDTGAVNRAPSATLTASSTYMSFVVSNLNDGVGSNSWGSVTDTNEWVVADFGSGNAYAITSWAWLASGAPDQSPTWSCLQFSDDASTWTNVCFALSPGWSSGQTKTWTVSGDVFGGFGSHTYWGIACLTSDAGNDFLLGDIGISATIGGSNQVGGGTAIAPFSYVSTPPAQAYDLDITTPWAAGGYIYGTPVVYQFPSAVSCAELTITTWNSQITKSPSKFDVIFSEDGHSYTVAWEALAATWTTAYQAQTFDNPN